MSGGSRGVYVCVCACAHTHSRASLHACEPIWKHILSLKCSNTHSNHSLKKSTSLVIQWREWYTVYQDTKSNPLLNKCHYLFSQFWWVNLRLHTRRIYYTRIQQQAQRGKKKIKKIRRAHFNWKVLQIIVIQPRHKQSHREEHLWKPLSRVESCLCPCQLCVPLLIHVIAEK